MAGIFDPRIFQNNAFQIAPRYYDGWLPSKVDLARIRARDEANRRKVERERLNTRRREEAALKAWDEVTYVPPPPRPTVIKRSDLGPANTYSPLSPELVAALQAHQQQKLEAAIDEDDLECLLLAL